MLTKEKLKKLVPNVGLNNESDREVWLKKTLSNLPEGSKILDAGAGTQRYKAYCEHLDYTSQDFAEYDGKGDNTALQCGTFNYGKLDIVSDIINIPEKDNTYDAIMCIEVLEHIPNPVLAIKEFSRLLKPGGTLILTAPFCSLTHFAPYHFSSGLNRYWYSEHLVKNNFTDINITNNGNFFEFLGQEIYRIPEISRRYTDKKMGPLTLLALYFIQKFLMKQSKRDKGSDEVLCFGYNVTAVIPKA